MTDIKVEQAIENICELGCQEVTKVIQELSTQQSSDLTESFNYFQRQAILNELNEIMSVYDKPCNLRY